MGYDGHLKVNVCKEGVKSALKLIEWAAPD
jgi:hypothetical protein